MQQVEHTEHVHCFICGGCMNVPIKVLIDVEIDSREQGLASDGLICDVCI
jgi:hypothetical protein